MDLDDPALSSDGCRKESRAARSLREVGRGLEEVTGAWAAGRRGGWTEVVEGAGEARVLPAGDGIGTEVRRRVGEPATVVATENRVEFTGPAFALARCRFLARGPGGEAEFPALVALAFAEGRWRPVLAFAGPPSGR
ncbi:MAG: hypothetical protein L0216_08760 [Planctomycetales bacterium]|nr:hypothetical protein [Planctomycetales bacterium]